MMKIQWSKLCSLVIVAWLLLMPMTIAAAEHPAHKGDHQGMPEQGKQAAKEKCPLCSSEPKGARVVVTLENGKQEAYGCLFCALAGLDPALVAKAQVTDFLSRSLVPAAKAFYVKDTSYGECCVNWLAFASKEQALKFAKGFGGKVLTFEQIVKEAKN